MKNAHLGISHLLFILLDLFQRLSAHPYSYIGHRWCHSGTRVDTGRRGWASGWLLHTGPSDKTRSLSHCSVSFDAWSILWHQRKYPLHPHTLGAPHEPTFQGGATFGHLFRRSLHEQGVLCIGLYRLHEDQPVGSDKRFVITSPPSDMILQDLDKVLYVSTPQKLPAENPRLPFRSSSLSHSIMASNTNLIDIVAIP